MDHETDGHMIDVTGSDAMHAFADAPLASARSLATARPRPAQRRRLAIVGWSLAAVVLVAAGVAGAVVHVTAHRSYDTAAAALRAATAEARGAADRLRTVTDEAADSAAAAAAILPAAGDDLVDIAARTRFADAATASSDAVQSAADLLDVPIEMSPAEKPFWTWELWTGASDLEAGSERLDARLDVMKDAAGVVDERDRALHNSAIALFASVPPAAVALETANVSARSTVVLDFRDAGATVARQNDLWQGAVDAFAAYAEKAASLKVSSQAELAEKAGPLLARRLEIEAFARSIAGGVVIDFDWAFIVNDRGGSAWMSGNAQWENSRGGYATITLSDSVAENWPVADAKALVAHEVGHAITAKCGGLFDSDSRASNEAWATAWAISMGHTAEGNGVQSYGYPPQELIEIAATCR